MPHDDVFDLGAFSDDEKNAWSLPAPYYYAPEVFEAERHAIFFKSWRFVGHRSELVEPGDYLTEDICGAGVLVVLTQEGELKAYHNVCQHRGHQLVRNRKGKLGGFIRCPYHSWTYTLDGGLRAARNSEKVASFDKTTVRLPPVAVDVLCGFVFVNLDLDAEPLAEQVPDFEPTLRQFFPDLDAMRWIEQTNFAIDANWKVCAENGIDGYHVFLSGPHHRAFGEVVDGHNMTIYTRPGWALIHAGEGTPDNAAYDFRANAGKGQTSNYVTFFLWPDLLLFTYPHVNGLWSFLMAPEGPESTREEIAAYTPGGVAMDAVTASAVAWIANELGPEDVDLNVGVQKGLRSPGYTQGRLLVDAERSDLSEHPILFFQITVLEALGRLPKGSARKLHAATLPKPL